MNYRKRKSIFILYLFFILFSQANNVINTNLYFLTVNNGLSQQDVEACVQDKHGFLWFATYDGLNRFDGLNFKVYRHNPLDSNSISYNRITNLCTMDSLIWIGTENHSIIKYNLNNNRFENVTSLIGSYESKHSKINTISEILNKQILIATSTGLYIYNTGNGLTEIIDTCNVNSVVVFKNRIYSCTNNGINIYCLNQQGKYEIISRIFEGNVINQIKISYDEERILVCTDSKLCFLNMDGSVDSSVDFDNKVLDVIEWMDDNLIVLTTRKMYLINSNGKYRLNNDFFKNNLLKRIFKDRENNIWILSGNKGIAKMSENSIVFNKLSIDDSDIFVKSFLKTRAGTCFIGTKDNGLYVIKNNKTKNLLKTQFVSNLFEDNRNIVWIFSNNIIYQYDDSKEILQPLRRAKGYPKEYSDKGMAVTQDRLNNLWIVQNNGFLKVSCSDSFSKTMNYEFIEYSSFLKNELSDCIITSFIFDEKKNCFWLGTQGKGLYKIRIDDNIILEGNISTINIPTIKSNLIWSLALDWNNNVWIGTDIGLYKMESFEKADSLKYRIYPFKNELLSTKKIMAISISNDSTLWLNTSQGLLSYKPSNKSISHYDHLNGLLSNTFTEASFIKNDTLYVGNINGVNFFNTTMVKKNTVPPLIAVDDIKIMGESIKKNDTFFSNSNKKLSLEYNKNSITIDVKAIHFENSKSNHISYYLKGNDKIWTTTNNNQIIYNNLSIGKYTLLIKASNSDGIWSDNYSLEIYVKPPFWKTWWAYSLYVILLFSILYLLKKRYDFKRKRMVELQIERIKHKSEVEIAEHKIRFHTDLMQEIRTPLTLISSYLYEIYNSIQENNNVKSKIHTVNKNISYLLRCVNETLDLQRIVDGEYKLRVKYNNISNTIRSVIDLFDLVIKDKCINVNIINEVNDSEQTVYDNNVISNILFNIINNSMLNCVNNGDLIIHCYLNNDNLNINVDNNGEGIDACEVENIFNKYFQSRNGQIRETRLGLVLAKQLIELHKGNIRVANIQNGGVSLSIKFPIILDKYNEDEFSPDIDDVKFNNFQFIDSADTSIELYSENPKMENITILIIDEDIELSNYVSSIFDKFYSVVVKNDAEKGFEYAINNIPDIIITDINFGKSQDYDGVNIIKKIRNNNIIENVPVIVLSSNSNQENIIVALMAGANDYIVRPCYQEVLLIKVRNILNSRSINIGSGNNEKHSLGDKFLTEIKELILREMTNPEFSIDFICDYLHISRMQLHRKMLSYTGESTSNFIRNIRFSEAYKLLTETDMNVSEVMFAIGLSNLSSFTVTFYKKFNILPSEVKKKKK